MLSQEDRTTPVQMVNHPPDVNDTVAPVQSPLPIMSVGSSFSRVARTPSSKFGNGAIISLSSLILLLPHDFEWFAGDYGRS